ncbi:YeeE/YedE thiosulfate transporter family protein [Reinekea marina]|uniref:YeeE/YedE family protein n=1 Tax=Reinekea marina TaxID=1310421 RepID=A0ABV7WTI2_9GAMM|nr:YeeE/YedE thiosulfate transporter family protein [Reinekea marina]MBU2862831.1 YeeE/YedE family protein [Reinekea forsetii]MDN3649082.1 YeeE/YedE thiosulfate transporter family protein [Reinekea marina]
MEIVNFTPYSAAIGGAILGLSAALLLFAKGRVAGISGIAGGVIVPEKGDTLWRVVFIAGLILGGFIYQWISKGTDSALFVGVQHIESVVSTPLLILAGLLVGVGTTIGTGCTSGHGICGLARKSPRSLVATLSFMAAGFVTVFIMKSLLGVGA